MISQFYVFGQNRELEKSGYAFAVLRKVDTNYTYQLIIQFTIALLHLFFISAVEYTFEFESHFATVCHADPIPSSLLDVMSAKLETTEHLQSCRVIDIKYTSYISLVSFISFMSFTSFMLFSILRRAIDAILALPCMSKRASPFLSYSAGIGSGTSSACTPGPMDTT
ncbi:uncharacterized protein BDR25DRAFT_358467 [Lindgomyces ingoldianus]|uniref:Uncharacterized protein n=1 Tax=Lindgomyces ingoldianus TaxID=673940 RepID=A0ACB6QMK0_9PLEO|nr:uncharacterized protein BDR25DRAFT_358467 [Lindgomyces ingoldianus]KAF2467755.1 hypothetical protein BDR25DRAFT_358467 [Lindgomyces ingoldianus]